MTSPRFGEEIAAQYERGMVPLLFEPYASDLAERVRQRGPAQVLELAAGTGVVTRALAEALPPTTAIVATELQQPMLDVAIAAGTARPVEWRIADALALPFPDAAFDLAVCQFGVMFFPERVTAYAEMRRVVRPGGWVLFNTWDRTSENDIAAAVHEALTRTFPSDPPTFFERVPHGYHDPATIRAELAAAGFGAPSITTLTARSRAETARAAALALCAGSPLRAEIEARDPSRLDEAIAAATELIAQRFGRGAVGGAVDAPIDAKMQALVVEVAR